MDVFVLCCNRGLRLPLTIFWMFFFCPVTADCADFRRFFTDSFVGVCLEQDNPHGPGGPSTASKPRGSI